MFAYLDGTVAEAREGLLILDVHQVGYLLSISARDLALLPPVGERVKVYTYLQVREDALVLFGFLNREDLEIFQLLLTVSGVGPKAALGILSSLSANDIRFAVLSDDVKTISKAPGIGTKTAKKLILELKDKFSLEEAFEQKLAENGQSAGAAAGSHSMTDAKAEAVQALAALGYSNSEALRAVSQVSETEYPDTESILKQALKKMI